MWFVGPRTSCAYTPLSARTSPLSSAWKLSEVYLGALGDSQQQYFRMVSSLCWQKLPIGQHLGQPWRALAFSETCLHDFKGHSHYYPSNSPQAG